jgi:hypothetical protein
VLRPVIPVRMALKAIRPLQVGLVDDVDCRMAVEITRRRAPVSPSYRPLIELDINTLFNAPSVYKCNTYSLSGTLRRDTAGGTVNHPV